MPPKRPAVSKDASTIKLKAVRLRTEKSRAVLKYGWCLNKAAHTQRKVAAKSGFQGLCKQCAKKLKPDLYASKLAKRSSRKKNAAGWCSNIAAHSRRTAASIGYDGFCSECCRLKNPQAWLREERRRREKQFCLLPPAFYEDGFDYRLPWRQDNKAQHQNDEELQGQSNGPENIEVLRGRSRIWLWSEGGPDLLDRVEPCRARLQQERTAFQFVCWPCAPEHNYVLVWRNMPEANYLIIEKEQRARSAAWREDGKARKNLGKSDLRDEFGHLCGYRYGQGLGTMPVFRHSWASSGDYLSFVQWREEYLNQWGRSDDRYDFDLPARGTLRVADLSIHKYVVPGYRSTWQEVRTLLQGGTEILQEDLLDIPLQEDLLDNKPVYSRGYDRTGMLSSRASGPTWFFEDVELANKAVKRFEFYFVPSSNTRFDENWRDEDWPKDFSSRHVSIHSIDCAECWKPLARLMGGCPKHIRRIVDGNSFNGVCDVASHGRLSWRFDPSGSVCDSCAPLRKCRECGNVWADIAAPPMCQACPVYNFLPQLAMWCSSCCSREEISSRLCQECFDIARVSPDKDLNTVRAQYLVAGPSSVVSVLSLSCSLYFLRGSWRA